MLSGEDAVDNLAAVIAEVANGDSDHSSSVSRVIHACRARFNRSMCLRT
jgi:hypothetical protein